MLMTEKYNIFYRNAKTTVKMRVIVAFLCLISVTLAFTLPEQEEPEDYLTVEQEDFKPFDEENNEPGLFDDEDEHEPRSFDDEEDELGVAVDEEDNAAGLFDDEDENEPGFLDDEPGVPYVEDE